MPVDKTVGSGRSCEQGVQDYRSFSALATKTVERGLWVQDSGERGCSRIRQWGEGPCRQ